jgi:hypothetical protein
MRGGSKCGYCELGQNLPAAQSDERCERREVCAMHSSIRRPPVSGSKDELDTFRVCVRLCVAADAVRTVVEAYRPCLCLLGGWRNHLRQSCNLSYLRLCYGSTSSNLCGQSQLVPMLTCVVKRLMDDPCPCDSATVLPHIWPTLTVM